MSTTAQGITPGGIWRETAQAEAWDGSVWAYRSVSAGEIRTDSFGRGGLDGNRRINPMQSSLPMHVSPRCGARTRSGHPCQSPAMPNGRCRMHGGLSPGAPKGNRNAFKHGRYTAEAITARCEVGKMASLNGSWRSRAPQKCSFSENVHKVIH